MDLRFRVGGQRIEGRALFSWSVVGYTVHAAARRENKGSDPGQLGLPRQLDAGSEVYIKCDVLERLAHGVVGYRRKMHDGVNSLQDLWLKMSHVREILDIHQALRKNFCISQAVRKISLV